MTELGGTVICGDAFEPASFFGCPPAPLIICDAPYGKIVRKRWDVAAYFRWFQLCESLALPDATIVMWGGIGKPGHRPFLDFASRIESRSDFEIKNWITWKKRRAYGVADNYLFTREELLILTRGSPVFNIPLLDEKRGYPGYNAKYSAKSEFLRRSNVWTDITELFRNKLHPTQKPDALYEVLIETHSAPGDLVIDPAAGSGPTVRACVKTGRRYWAVEKDPAYLARANLASTQPRESIP